MFRPATPTHESATPVATATNTEPTPTSAVATIDGHITVRQWNRVHLVRVEDIDFVEAEDNYVVVHTASRAYKGRDRISELESQLDPRRFVRIHRSTIVHVGKIREVQPLTHGDHAVILRDGKVLRVARSRRQALGQALGVEL
jgi:two-component system, LytTR family, response regulator